MQTVAFYLNGTPRFLGLGGLVSIRGVIVVVCGVGGGCICRLLIVIGAVLLS